MAECVAERKHSSFCNAPRVVWHLADGEATDDATFRAIRCDDREGILLPGNGHDREPTCPDCWRIYTLEKAGVHAG